MTPLTQFSRVDTSKPAWLMAMRIIAPGSLEPNAVSFSFALCEVANQVVRNARLAVTEHAARGEVFNLRHYRRKSGGQGSLPRGPIATRSCWREHKHSETDLNSL
jgi:hypothetical protein